MIKLRVAELLKGKDKTNQNLLITISKRKSEIFAFKTYKVYDIA